MTDKEIDREWLEKAEKYDKENTNNLNWISDLSDPDYRKVKALEIIAWQLIKLNENFDSLKDIIPER